MRENLIGILYLFLGIYFGNYICTALSMTDESIENNIRKFSIIRVIILVIILIINILLLFIKE